MWGDSPSPARLPHQPSEALWKVVFVGQVTEEEAESLSKRKPCSAPKWKEMSGSGIFAAGANGDAEDSGNAAAIATPGWAASRNHQHLDWHSRVVPRNREGCEECAANEEKQLIEKVAEMLVSSISSCLEAGMSGSCSPPLNSLPFEQHQESSSSSSQLIIFAVAAYHQETLENLELAIKATKKLCDVSAIAVTDIDPAALEFLMSKQPRAESGSS